MAQIAREKKSTVKKVAYEKGAGVDLRRFSRSRCPVCHLFHFHRRINERTGDRT